MATIEIDGKTFEANNGKMIIEVADDAGIYIPRFCYHKKLSIAANCRMCLVEITNSKKTVPACATPIADGMKVFTKSPSTIKSQQAVMEFLLINHPLDCPICDQGGECELQDLAMGYGYDSSEYDESKRAVADDDLGSLISTEMTRCIQCTRCVRFGEEIAGVRELGATGRGEKMQITTYVQHSLTSEVSGNIIDLCPVGALTSKPFRFKARSWEMSQYDGVAPHDCLGSNIHLHVLNNKVMRVVPRENEAINETWISDRDRFSYLGLESDARATLPMIKKNGKLEKVDWQTALTFAAEGIASTIKKYGPEQFAAFASPSSTLEELYLCQKLMRELGVNNLDHRLQQTDFRDDENHAMVPNSSLPFAELENQKTILLLGCNVNREVPLIGLKVRKAFIKGAKIYAINPRDFTFNFDLTAKIINHPQDMQKQLAKLLKSLAAGGGGEQLPAEIQNLLQDIIPDEESIAIANALSGSNNVIITGCLFENHPDVAILRTLVYWLEKLTTLKVLRITAGANSTGASLAGMVPHHGPFAANIAKVGLNIQAALEAQIRGYFLLALDPLYDLANSALARKAMANAEFVVMLSAFEEKHLLDFADVLLPIAPFAETSGTYINLDQTWQTTKGVKKPHGESRPAWKICRVLANMLNCKGFDYVSSEEILTEIKNLSLRAVSNKYSPYYPKAFSSKSSLKERELLRVSEQPLYRVDQLVRHAKALQLCSAADLAYVVMHPDTAKRLNLENFATIVQEEYEVSLPLRLDECMDLEAIYVPSAFEETAGLAESFGVVTIK